jgi:hypothetical protein
MTEAKYKVCFINEETNEIIKTDYINSLNTLSSKLKIDYHKLLSIYNFCEGKIRYLHASNKEIYKFIRIYKNNINYEYLKEINL